MASINMRQVSIFLFFIAAIFIMHLLLIIADQSGEFKTERYDSRTPPAPQGNVDRGMFPPESSSPPPIYS